MTFSPISLDESPQQLSKESHVFRTCIQICAYYDPEHKSDPPFLIGSNPMAIVLQNQVALIKFGRCDIWKITSIVHINNRKRDKQQPRSPGDVVVLF